jgi:2-dehydro-3-deoxyglucarate aldolase
MKRMVLVGGPRALDAVDAIATDGGVDGLFVGPSDLAALGRLGDADARDMQQAIRHIFARAQAAGKPAGVEADARRYLEWGMSFVAVGSDLGVFRAATQALGDKFKLHA